MVETTGFVVLNNVSKFASSAKKERKKNHKYKQNSMREKSLWIKLFALTWELFPWSGHSILGICVHRDSWLDLCGRCSCLCQPRAQMEDTLMRAQTAHTACQQHKYSTLLHTHMPNRFYIKHTDCLEIVPSQLCYIEKRHLRASDCDYLAD